MHKIFRIEEERRRNKKIAHGIQQEDMSKLRKTASFLSSGAKQKEDILLPILSVVIHLSAIIHLSATTLSISLSLFLLPLSNKIALL